MRTLRCSTSLILTAILLSGCAPEFNIEDPLTACPNNAQQCFMLDVRAGATGVPTTYDNIKGAYKDISGNVNPGEALSLKFGPNGPFIPPNGAVDLEVIGMSGMTAYRDIVRISGIYRGRTDVLAFLNK